MLAWGKTAEERAMRGRNGGEVQRKAKSFQGDGFDRVAFHLHARNTEFKMTTGV